MLRKYFYAIILLANVSLTAAQTNDWGLWTGLEATKNLSEKWNLDVVAGQYVWKDNISDKDQIRTGACATRNLGDNFSLGAGYLLIFRYREDAFKYRHRYYLQPMYRYKFGRFTADWRVRTELTLLGRRDETIDMFDRQNTNWLVRNRFRLRYTTKDGQFRPYAHFELFHRLFRGWDNSYHENRVTIGTTYKINRNHSVDLGYRLESEDIDLVRFRRSVIVVGYSYSF
jgi:hypothetical protein